ncbi:hypothetical protein BGY98DRAFT_304026 [Russula aff. rugulosa BPL654]|nr:hypothetical protein BGY98DRAFT_304026 [Russula aff. rugulosa BPL654]
MNKHRHVRCIMSIQFLGLLSGSSCRTITPCRRSLIIERRIFLIHIIPLFADFFPCSGANSIPYRIQDREVSPLSITSFPSAVVTPHSHIGASTRVKTSGFCLGLERKKHRKGIWVR